MKKNRMFDAKGFMLVETLLVSLTISGILVYMYAQFSTINNSYQNLYNFNTANSLYRAAALREYMLNYTEKNWAYYQGVTAKTFDCNLVANGADLSYCLGIVSALDAKQIIFTRDNFNEARVLEKVSDPADKAKLTKFLNTVKRYSTSKYRFIIIFNDGTFATVLF